MPRIVDYPAVVAQAAAQRFVSLYPNSGAFGFPPDVPTFSVGWVTYDDPTLRPAARTLAVAAPTPTTNGLARLAERAWHELLGVDGAATGGLATEVGPLTAREVWVTPKAHWAYELDFGSTAWMGDLLRRVDIDPEVLARRHDGSAVAFAPPTEATILSADGAGPTGDPTTFVTLVDGLLANLLGSDFQLMFPGRDVVCTVHHHKQLWWTSPDERLIGRLRGLAQ